MNSVNGNGNGNGRGRGRGNSNGGMGMGIGNGRRLRDGSCRRIGMRKDSYDDESTAEVLKRAKQMLRCDYGGKKPEEWVKSWMAEANVEVGPVAIKRILEALNHQREGMKKRMFPRLDEGIERTGEKTSPEEILP